MSHDASWQPPKLDRPALDRIRKLCAEFEDAWSLAGEEPDLEPFIDQLKDLRQQHYLLVQLIRASNSQREKRGWTIAHASEYARQFPTAQKAIQHAFRPRATAGPPRPNAPDANPSDGTREAVDVEFIGRYQVRRVLGQGAFGIVYLAHDPQLDRLVALKVSKKKVSSKKRAPTAPQTLELFLGEARAVAGLKHPQIVPIYDFGQLDDGRCFLVYEFVEGQDLAEFIREHPLAAREATELVAVVAEALHEAHRNGIFHRDVKPSNILIDGQGRPRLVDFGLALRVADVGSALATTGSPGYMSPEQAAGQSGLLDGRADVFSLGIVYYELLTGVRPFKGRDLQDTLDRVCRMPARPPRQIDDSLPAAMERVCLKALEKRPDDRFSTARDMAEALRATLTEAPTPPTNIARAGNVPTPEAISRVLEHYHRRLLEKWDAEGRPPCYVEPGYSLLVSGRPEDLSRWSARQRHQQARPDVVPRQVRPVQGAAPDPSITADSAEGHYEPLEGETAEEQLEHLLRDARRICMTGDAGTGKSVFTSRLAALLATQATRDKLLGPGPWMITRWEQRVRSWPRRFDASTLVDELAAMLATSCQQSAPDLAPGDVAAWLLRQGRVLLILDALDQVSDEEILESLQESLHSGPAAECRIVVTSRSHAVNQRAHLFTGTGPWRFGRVDGFDAERQDAYLLEACGGSPLADLLPNRSAIGPLLESPLVLSLIGRLARAGELSRFQTQSDLYLQLDRFLVTRAAQKLGWQVDDMRRARWREILAATACEMMCRQVYDYSVRGDDAVQALRHGAALRCDRTIEPAEWREIERISDFTEHTLLEDASDRLLSFKHRTLMEFYCGLHLACNSQPEWVHHEIEGDRAGPHRCGDGEVADQLRSPDWYWAVRFAIELNPQVWQSRPQVLLATLASLFQTPERPVPAHPVRARPVPEAALARPWPRPTELMYRAWKLLEPDARGKSPVDGGAQVLQHFEQAYVRLVREGHATAVALLKGFVPCPPRPPLRVGLGVIFRRQSSASAEPVEFPMGADDFPRDAPRHHVRVTPFDMLSIAVTRDQYRLFDPDHAARFTELLDKHAPHAECPVVMVSWYDAWVFARWVGGRLPTEAEWELACRAGSTSRYWWGDEFDASRCNAGGEAGTTLAPALPRRNAWGLYDMLGNVGEWCQDWFGRHYYAELAARPAAADPSGPPEGSSRILRGGSWTDLGLACRCAHREHDVPYRRSYCVGFRVVRGRRS